MKDLVFEAPEFREGVNLTVRRGEKWNRENGTPVNLVDTRGKCYGQSYILTATCPFSDLEYDPDTLLCEHDSSCRTYSGLRRAMREIYPDFLTSETVTLVWFICHKQP